MTSPPKITKKKTSLPNMAIWLKSVFTELIAIKICIDVLVIVCTCFALMYWCSLNRFDLKNRLLIT